MKYVWRGLIGIGCFLMALAAIIALASGDLSSITGNTTAGLYLALKLVMAGAEIILLGVVVRWFSNRRGRSR